MSVWRATLPYDLLLIIAHISFLAALPKNKRSPTLLHAGSLKVAAYYFLYGMAVTACNTAVFTLFGVIGLKISAAICLLVTVAVLNLLWWNSERRSHE